MPYDSKLFCKRLNECLKQKGIEQKMLAEKLGIHKGTVSSYFTGRAFPNPNALYEIARFFNISLDYLMGLTDEPKPLIPPEDEIYGEDYQFFRKTCRALSERERKGIINLIKSLLNEN